MSGPIVDVQIPYPLTDLQIKALHVWLNTVCTAVEKRRPFARRNQRHHDRERDQRESLLVRLLLWQDETDNPRLQRYLAQMQHNVQRKTHDYWEVSLTDGQQLGTSYPITAGLRPFGVDVQAYQPLYWKHDAVAPIELEDWFHITGSVPFHRIQLSAFNELIEDHLLAAYMAADLADQYEGWVKVRVRPHFYTRRAEAEWTQDDTRQLVASIAGRAHEIEYATPHGTKAYHIVDGEFLRNWAEHAQFHLFG